MFMDESYDSEDDFVSPIPKSSHSEKKSTDIKQPFKDITNITSRSTLSISNTTSSNSSNITIKSKVDRKYDKYENVLDEDVRNIAEDSILKAMILNLKWLLTKVPFACICATVEKLMSFTSGEDNKYYFVKDVNDKHCDVIVYHVNDEARYKVTQQAWRKASNNYVRGTLLCDKRTILTANYESNIAYNELADFHNKYEQLSSSNAGGNAMQHLKCTWESWNLDDSNNSNKFTITWLFMLYHGRWTEMLEMYHSFKRTLKEPSKHEKWDVSHYCGVNTLKAVIAQRRYTCVKAAINSSEDSRFREHLCCEPHGDNIRRLNCNSCRCPNCDFIIDCVHDNPSSLRPLHIPPVRKCIKPDATQEDI